jgi:phage portal protein BeeE
LAGYEKRDASDLSWSALAPGIGYYAGLSARAAENLSTVLACTNAIATALAYVPALIYRHDGDGNRVEVTTHPMGKISRVGVNDQMSWPDFLEHFVASTLLTGNGLAVILRNGNGQLAGFRYVPWGMVTVCLAPWARKIEAEFARSVFPSGGPYELELDLSGFLRGDPETRWAAHKIAIETGVLDADEVRQIEGWNPRPAGQKPVPANEGGQTDG